MSVDRIKAEAEREIRELLKKYPRISIESLKVNCENCLRVSQSAFLTAEDGSPSKTDLATRVVAYRARLCVLEAALRDSGEKV